MVQNKGKNKGHENLIPIKKGERLNPNGRPLGQKNYATLFKEAIIKLAKLNNKEPDELELEIISKGIMNARAGEFNFYKDVLDRLHGKPQESIQHSGEIKTTIQPIMYDNPNTIPLSTANISTSISKSNGPGSEESDISVEPPSRKR